MVGWKCFSPTDPQKFIKIFSSIKARQAVPLCQGDRLPVFLRADAPVQLGRLMGAISGPVLCHNIEVNVL
jgi:hypothetical protein